MNDTDNNQKEEYVSVSLEYGPGQTLADGREAKGLTIADVAGQLNVTEEIVNGLERDDYNSLPPAIYTRGYLRNYANLLGIDPEPLLDRQKKLTSNGEDEEIKKPAAIQAETSGRMIKKTQFKRSKDRSSMLFIILLVLMMGGIGYGIYALITKSSVIYPSSSAVEQAQMYEEQQASDDLSSESTIQDTISIPEQESDKESTSLEESEEPQEQSKLITQNEQIQTLSLSLPVSNDSNEIESNNTDADDKIADQNLSDVEVEEVIPVYENDTNVNIENNTDSASEMVDAQPIVQKKPDKNEIKVIVAGDSYIEITDAAGKRFFYRVLTAGTVKEISGIQPFKVVLGNAGAVKLEYNGEPYDFGEYGLGKVARFSIQ